MKRRVVVFSLLFCLLFLAGLTLFEKDAFAAGGEKMDMSKKGLDALGSKEFDQNRLPGKKEIGFAVGSVITMIAVFKYA